MSEVAKSNETPGVALPPPRLLVVDDEPDICDILVDWLTPRGYVVETAGDADAALARLAEGGVDGMILDLHLPGRDGLEVMEESRELDPELAILIMTGFATTDSAIEALRQRVDDYLQKPFDLNTLVRAIDRSLERRRLREENLLLLEKLRSTNEDLDRRVDEKTRSLSTLLDTTQVLSGTLDLETVLTHIAERARALFDARAALLYLRRGDEVVREVTTGVDPQRHPQLIEAVETIVERVAREEAPWRSQAGEPPIDSAIAVPLKRDGKTSGVLVLIAQEGGGAAEERGGHAPTASPAFSDEQTELALGFATHAAVALGNAQLYEETKRLDRLQSAFIAAVSHELRTPLTTMKAPLEILASKYGQSLNEAGQQILAICRDSAERLEDLVELILFSAESEEELDVSQFEAVDVAALVGEAVQRIEGVAAHKEVPIEVELPVSPAPVLAYRRGLVRVLVCLLSNAVKFSEQGQRVRLMAECEEMRVRVHVVDEGVGIDPADQPLIFKRFAQLDGSLTKRAGGTGLGLSVARALVEQHGGEIQISSRVGAGSRFTVELPLHVAAGAEDGQDLAADDDDADDVAAPAA
jgi:signal transduction histidine kinase/DNA-binding response OmpR family regulator